jgi:hypothetical protein
MVVAAFTWGVAGGEHVTVPTGAMRVSQAMADAVSVRVLWIAPPGALPDAVREVQQNVVSPRHRLLTNDGLRIHLGPDGTRPTALGYAGWAGAVWKQLEAGA